MLPFSYDETENCLRTKKSSVLQLESGRSSGIQQKTPSKIAEVGFSCLAEALSVFSKKQWPQKTSAGGKHWPDSQWMERFEVRMWPHWGVSSVCDYVCMNVYIYMYFCSRVLAVCSSLSKFPSQLNAQPHHCCNLVGLLQLLYVAVQVDLWHACPLQIALLTVSLTFLFYYMNRLSASLLLVW